VWFELRNKEYELDESDESKEEVEQPTLVVRRSKHVIKPVEKYSPTAFHFTFILTSTGDEPKSVTEAFDSTEGKLWKDIMVEEIESLQNNETRDLVKLPSGRNHVGRRWVFKKMINVVGQVNKFKA
jgi:hypothetical protein